MSNPNPVPKAHHALEHSGFFAVRPGVGTFVTFVVKGAPLTAPGPLRQDLQRGQSESRKVGIDDESVEALFLNRICSTNKEDKA